MYLRWKIVSKSPLCIGWSEPETDLSIYPYLYLSIFGLCLKCFIHTYLYLYDYIYIFLFWVVFFPTRQKPRGLEHDKISCFSLTIRTHKSFEHDIIGTIRHEITLPTRHKLHDIIPISCWNFYMNTAPTARGRFKISRHPLSISCQLRYLVVLCLSHCLQN